MHSTTRRRPATARIVLLVTLLLCVGFVLPAAAQSITGHVFEDQGYAGGSGRNFATAGGAVTGARVELYAVAGTAHFICSTTTSAAGVYTFTNGAGGCTLTDSAGGVSYTVRVVNNTVVSNYTGGVAGLYPVQTYGTSCTPACGAAPTAITNYVGGQSPATQDPGNGAAGAAYPAGSESLATVQLTTGHTAASNIDFGFNFFTIVNVNATGQGSLANFITNANTLTGATASAIFMISDGNTHNGLTTNYASLLTATANGSVFRITAGSMPTVTAAGTTIDASNEITNLGANPNTGTYGPAGITLGTSATTLPQWTGTTAPSVEITSNNGDQQWQFTGSGDTVKGFALAQFTLYLIGSNEVAQDNMVGMHADETITTTESTFYGVQLGAGTGITVNHNLVSVNNSGIRHENLSVSGDIVEYNDVDLPSGSPGQSNTFDGILMVGPGTFTGETIQYNYVHNMRGGGIEIGFADGGGAANTTCVGETIQYNTVQYNGWVLNGTGPKSSTYTYSTPSTEPINVAVWGVTLGSTVFVKNNLVSNAGGVGVLIENAYGFTISQNSIYRNGYSASFTATQGPGISLYNSNVDPNGFGTSTGINPNTGTLNPAMPNNFMNYPVITLATYTGNNLRLKGYVGGATNLTIANASVEFFIADNTDNNQNGQIFLGDGLNVPHGEGKTYVGHVTADSQGLFDLTIPSSSFPAGVTITAGTTILTSTATDASSGSTSEFGPNQTVETSATSIQGYVYYDVNHSGSYNSGESWQNGAAVYAVLWDTTKNAQAAVGGVTLGAQTIAYGAATDTGFFSFDNVTPGDTYELFLSTVAPAAGGIYASKPAAGIPTGWINVNPNTADVSIPTTTTGPQIIVQNFGLFHGLKVSGEVFKDNGAGTGGVANDGHLNGSEPGIPNVVLTAKDSFSVQLDQETTNGGGAYTLWLPAIDSSSNTVSSVTLTLSQVGGYTATGDDPGTTTGATYSLTTYVFSFTPNWTTNASFTGVNFGFIQSGNVFAPNGQQTTVPGSFAVYAHQYTSITGGTVTFTETPAVSQPNYFSEILYRDTGCTGNLAAATYLPWGATGSVTIAAGGGAVCVLMKEMVSAAASFGMQNSVTITSAFSYGSGSSVANTTLTLTDVTTLDTRTSGDLQLVKSTYIDATCTYLNTLGPASSSFSTTAQSAQSGNCIEYQIQATNGGASALSGLTINDTAPPYTTLQTGTHSPVSSVGAAGCTGLTTGAIITSGTAVQAVFTGTMPAGCVATFVYEVKLN